MIQAGHRRKISFIHHGNRSFAWIQLILQQLASGIVSFQASTTKHLGDGREVYIGLHHPTPPLPKKSCIGGLCTTEKPNSPCLVQKIRAYLCYIHRYLFDRSFPSLRSNPLRVHGASTAAVASIWRRDIGIAPQVLQLGGLGGRKPCFTLDMFQIACGKSGASCNSYLSHQWHLLCS